MEDKEFDISKLHDSIECLIKEIREDIEDLENIISEEDILESIIIEEDILESIIIEEDILESIITKKNEELKIYDVLFTFTCF